MALVATTVVALPQARAALQNDGTVVRDIVVDGARSRLYVSAGPGSSAIRVVAYDGALLSTIPGQQGASGLVLSPDGTTLYAGLADGRAISVIDTASLTERRRVATGQCPDDLVLAGQRLWFTQGCSTSGRALYSMSLEAGGAITGPDVGWNLGDARLTSSGPGSSTIFAAGNNYGPVLRRIEVAGGTATVTGEKPALDLVHTASSIDVDPAGETVYLGGPVFAAAVSASTLEITRRFPTPDWGGATAVSLSPDGRHLGVVTRYIYRGPTFLLYPLDGGAPTHDETYPNAGSAARTLAFSPDGSRAFFGGEGSYGVTGVLLSAAGLATDPLTVSIDLEPAASPGAALVSGRLRSTDGASVAGRSVRVTVSTAAGTREVATVATAADGLYQVTDPAPPSGPGTYRAHWDGDGTRPAALSVVGWHPERPNPAASLPVPVSMRDPKQPLDLPGLTAMAVDEVHGRVYLAGGTGTTALSVHDSDGQSLAGVEGLRGPHGLALSQDHTTLYVTERDGRSVAVVDTATSQVVGRWSTSAFATYPERLAVAGGRLWIVANHGTTSDVVVDIDTRRPWEVVEHRDHTGLYSSNPLPVASPVDPAGLFVGMASTSEIDVTRLDTGADPPTWVARAPEAATNGIRWLQDLVASRDGDHVLIAATAVRELDATSLELVRTYPTDTAALAVAETADASHLATGVYAATGDDVASWARGGVAPIVRFALDGMLEPRSMAFTADSSRLFAVTKEGSDVVLHVLPRPFDPVSCRTDLQAGAGTAGSPLELRGTVVDGAGAPAEGAVVVLRRTDPSGQVTDRGRTTSNAAGQWSMEDTPAVPGRHRYETDVKAYGRSPTCSAMTEVDVAVATTTTTSSTTTTTTTTTTVPSTTTTTTLPTTTTTPVTPTSTTTQPATTTTTSRITTTTTSPVTTTTSRPSTPSPAATRAPGYWMVDTAGTVYPFGASRWMGNAAPVGEAVDLEPTPSGNGYWVLDVAGNVSAFGDARFFGGAAGFAAGETATSLSARPDGTGYWIFTNRGRVFPLGSAAAYGDLGAMRLNGPVLDSIGTPSGRGYYMVAEDGGIFAFGDARFFGSMGGSRLNAPVQSLVPDPDGTGYWLVASDGGIFSFGAAFFGSMGSTRLNRPITGMVGSRAGYLMVAEDGGIFAFGEAPFLGSLGGRPPAARIIGVAATG